MKRWITISVLALAATLTVTADRRAIIIARNNSSTSGSYTYTATKFDGTSDWLYRDGDWASAADTKVGLLSFWFKLNEAGEDGAARYVLHSIGDRFVIWFTTANELRIDGQDSAFNTAIALRTTTTFTASSTWHHALLAWNTATSTRVCYIDGASETLAGNFIADFFIDYAHGGTGSGWDWGFAAKAGGTDITGISISEFWFTTKETADITDSAVRAKFSSGHPISLGSDGSTPTGTAPDLYFKNSFSTFQNNLGTGGNWTTVNGTLEDDASIP